jgi:hypothetical protein
MSEISELAKRTRGSARKYRTNNTCIENKIVNALDLDISDRAGLKRTWESIEEDVKLELLELWKEIIRQEMQEELEWMSQPL